MKNSFNIWRLFTGQMRWHVVVVCIFVAFSPSGTAVAQPSAAETPLLPPRQSIVELSDGGLQSRKSGFKESVDVLRPIDGIWVDSAKLGEDSSAKLDGSNVKTINAVVAVN